MCGLNCEPILLEKIITITVPVIVPILGIALSYMMFTKNLKEKIVYEKIEIIKKGIDKCVYKVSLSKDGRLIKGEEAIFAKFEELMKRMDDQNTIEKCEDSEDSKDSTEKIKKIYSRKEAFKEYNTFNGNTFEDSFLIENILDTIKYINKMKNKNHYLDILIGSFSIFELYIICIGSYEKDKKNLLEKNGLFNRLKSPETVKAYPNLLGDLFEK